MSYTYIQNVDECYIKRNGWYSCTYADLDKYKVLYTNIYLDEYMMYTRMDKNITRICSGWWLKLYRWMDEKNCPFPECLGLFP